MEQHDHTDTPPESMTVNVGKYKLHLVTPNISVIVLVLVILGLCGFILQQHLTAIHLTHATVNGQIEKHHAQTERLLQALEAIVRYKDVPPKP